MAWVSVAWMGMGLSFVVFSATERAVAGLFMGALVCAMSVSLGLPFLGFRIDYKNRRLRVRQLNAFVDLPFDDIAVVEFPRSTGIFVPGLAVVDRSGRRIRAQLVRQGMHTRSDRLFDLKQLFKDAGVECGVRERSW